MVTAEVGEMRGVHEWSGLAAPLLHSDPELGLEIYMIEARFYHITHELEKKNYNRFFKITHSHIFYRLCIIRDEKSSQLLKETSAIFPVRAL